MSNTTVRITISITGPGKDDSVTLAGHEFIFGRGPASDCQINDPSFSRSHFKIFLNDDTLWITDIGSSNGTVLNDDLIGPQNPVEISASDRISIPNSQFEITLNEVEILRPDTDATTVINLQDLNFNSESDYTDLSEQIYEAAQLKVEQIIQDANQKSAEILQLTEAEIERKKIEAQKESDNLILDKQKKADTHIEKFKSDTKAQIQKDLQLEKEQQSESIKAGLLADRKIMLKRLEDEAAVITRENEILKQEQLQYISKLESLLASKKEEYEKLDSDFETKLKAGNEEVEQKLRQKKKELEKLEKNYHVEKTKLIEQVESEMADHRAELQQELSNLESKIKVKIQDIEKLDVDYKNKEASLLSQLESEGVVKKNEIQFVLNDLEQKVALKKNELVKLEQAHEAQKNNQFKLLEAQVENKKIELEAQLSEIETKIANAQKEFAGLFENYEAKKVEQTQIVESLKNQKLSLQQEIKDLEAKVAKSKKDTEDQIDANNTLIQVLQADVEKYKKSKNEAETNYKKVSIEFTDLQKNVSEIKKLSALEEAAIKEKRQTLQNLEAEIKKINSQKETLTPKLSALTAELAMLTKKVEVASITTANIQSDHDKQVATLKAAFLQNKAALDEEMRKHKEAEEQRIQNLTRQELNQINKIKEDSLRLVLDLEDSVTKEIAISTSKVFANTIGMEKFREIAPEYEKSIRASLQAGVLKLLKNELSTPDPTKKSLSSNQKSWKPITISVIASAFVFGVLPMVYRQVQDQNDPIRKQMEEQARAAAIIPVKKFTPEKVATLGSTFVNSVIYTEEFCEIYAQESFRSELMKKGSAYLYKQWQIDEEKSIQSYAMIFSMIDLLKEKTEKIDPDHEKKDIAKMVVIEKETMKKLEKILGNEVRLEAAMKFQTRFYQEYLAQRSVASGAKEEEKPASE